MRQHILFALQLGLIAWLRSVGYTPLNSGRTARIHMELVFGMLIILPLLR
jgi:hypothetical protein